MFCSASWSFEHYLPLDRREKLIIDQVIPSLHAIRLAWSGGSSPWTVWYRVKDSEEAWRPLTATEPHAVLSDLAAYIEYEFRVESGADKSLTGYARTGEVPGTVVNYLHPQDPKYAFSGQHLCSPSLLLHPDGYLLASTDLYDNGTPQNLTLIFRSDDGGKSWYHYTELFPCFWGSLFLHRGEVYMLSTSTEYGDLLIGKSSDGGKTWGAPTVLARGSCHRSAMGWHKSGMPVTEYKGRLWCGVDYGSHQLGRHMNCLASADASGDLLDAGNWAVTDPLAFDPAWEGAVKCDTRGCIEGNAVVSPDGKICTFLRYSTAVRAGSRSGRGPRTPGSAAEVPEICAVPGESLQVRRQVGRGERSVFQHRQPDYGQGLGQGAYHSVADLFSRSGTLVGSVRPGELRKRRSAQSRIPVCFFPLRRIGSALSQPHRLQRCPKLPRQQLSDL